MILLTRDEFKEQVFKRDNGRCVICHEVGVDAHHIIERKLFPDGGYVSDNGATLCADCHLKAEQTLISTDAIREAAGIVRLVLPPNVRFDTRFDKWLNPVLSNGRRLKGPMFHAEQVQKVLKDAGLLDIFDDYVKYPQTPHAPWSNPSSDDKYIDSMVAFENDIVVVTEKMDGENTNIYSDGYYHARSLDGRGGEDRSMIAELASRLQRELPVGWRICGENLYAQHSIVYNELNSYFNVFSIWDEENCSLSWDEVEFYCDMLGLQTVPVLYKGPYNKELIQSLFTPIKENGEEMEGYVIRLARGFHFSEFSECMAKFVRKNHVQTDKHWRYQAIKKNGLKI